MNTLLVITLVCDIISIIAVSVTIYFTIKTSKIQRELEEKWSLSLK